MKRHKTAYPGVFWKSVRRIGGKTGETERSYYIIYKKDGKHVEEHAGYQFRNDMTAARASKIRGERIENRRKSRREVRQEQAASGWTFAKIWEHYNSNSEHAINHADASRYQTYIFPTIADKTPPGLKPDDLKPVHELLSGKSPGTRYSVLQLINRLSRYAVKKNLCGPIPFYVELPRVEVTKTEQLTHDQLQGLLQVLHDDGGPVAKTMLMALLTGMRKGEILNLRWTHVDLGNGFITISAKTSKSRKQSKIPLNDPAREVIMSMDPATEYVFQPAHDMGIHRLMLQAAHLRSLAGLPQDFRPYHGMRHSFASFLASEGVPLYTVAKLLTHSNLQMTQRYAHLSDQALRQAADVAGDVISRASEVAVEVG